MRECVTERESVTEKVSVAGEEKCGGIGAEGTGAGHREVPF